MSLATPAARRDQSFHLHPSTNLRAVQKDGPLVIARGEGVYVYDDEGRRYLEGMAGLWCASLGFSERRLADAAHRQMCELPFYHSFGGKVPAISHRARRAADRDRAGGQWARSCSPIPAPRRTTRRSSSRGTSTTRSAGPPRRRSSRASARYHGVTIAIGQPDRPRLRARRLRPADRALPAHRCAALLSRRRGRAKARKRSPRASPATSKR